MGRDPDLPLGRRALRALWAASAAVLLWVVLLVAPARAATIVDHPDFSSVADLTFNVDAAQATNVLRLTPAASFNRGSAWTTAIVLKHKRSWKTRFAFSMHDTTGVPGDGMAFVAQSLGLSVIGESGGGLGYANVNPSIAVEFDTFDNGDGDLSANEVAVVVNGQAGDPLAAEEPGFALYGGERHAWVAYSALKKRLSVWVDDDESKPRRPLISVKRDLEKVLDTKARVGFTAATGGATAVHDVLSWKVTQ